MKNRSLAILLSLMSFGAFAQSAEKQDPIKNEKYCAEMKDGQLVLVNEGIAVTSEVTLNDGGKVTPACVVLKKNGNVQTLNKGECIDKEGNITNTGIPETPIKKGGSSEARKK